MARREILLATDLSARGDRAFDRAVFLADAWGARLTIASALEERLDDLVEHDGAPRWRRSDREVAAAEAQIRRDLEGKQVEVEVIVRRGNATAVLVEIARRTSYDLIITGIARSVGFTRAILGATVEAIVGARAGPVLVVKARVRGAYRTALVGTDFSEASRAALRSASALFPETGLTVLHAYRPTLRGITSTRESDAAARQAASAECARFIRDTLPDEAGEVRSVVEAGLPEPLLNEYAIDHEVDLMAVGTHGRNRVLSLLLGSIGSAVILSSPCDVLLVSTPGT